MLPYDYWFDLLRFNKFLLFQQSKLRILYWMQLSVFADKITEFPISGTKDYTLLLINCDLRSVSLKLSFVRSIPTQSTAPNSVLWYGLKAALSQPLIHQLSDVAYPSGVTREGVTVSRSGWHINTQCCKRNSNSINLELNNGPNAVVSCFPFAAAV